MLDVILIADEPWQHFSWRRRHHVAWALARNHKVLFVEPPYTVLTPFTNSNINWKQLLNLGRLKHQGRNLYSYSPVKVIPFSFPFAKVFDHESLNRKVIDVCLRRAANRLDMRCPILWVNFSYMQYYYFHLFNHKIVVTDWYDNFEAPLSEYSGEWATSEAYVNSIRERCDRILEHADIVFAVSKELYSDLTKLRNHVYFVPHGVDYDLFKEEKQLPKRLETHLQRLPHPILGFVGTIQAKLDFDLLLHLKRRHPEWVMLFVGREHINNNIDKRRFDELKQMNGVLHVGHVERELIPAIMKYIDVCLLPFKKNRFNFSTSGPLKLWEYLAGGKPVVAVNQGTPFECKEFVRGADDRESFEDAVLEAVGEREDLRRISRRKEVAKENSWERRVDEMLELIERELQ